MSHADSIEKSVALANRNRYTPKFERFVAQHNGNADLKLFTRLSDSNQIRHFIQVPADAIEPFVRNFGARQNILGIFCLPQKGGDHPYLRIGSRVYHLQHQEFDAGEWCWTMNDRGRKNYFRASKWLLTERLIQLKPTELKRLRSFIEEIQLDMASNEGRIKFRGNCVGAWMRARIGYAGKSLAEVVGISELDHGPTAMNELLETGNERVIGAAFYPPRGSELKNFDRIKLKI